MLNMMQAVQDYQIDENGAVLVMVWPAGGPRDYYRDQAMADSGPGQEGSSGVGIDPRQISLDTQGLPYPWQPNVVPERPYDASMPPGPVGLPEHIQVNFGVVNPEDRQPGDPIMYIIPALAYKQMWDNAGDESVTNMINRIFQLTGALPYPPPTSGLPVLPYEEIGSGFNDLAVQVGRISANEASATKNGYRFVGRFPQDYNPVTSDGLKYYYQGFTNDGQYLVAFFYPVSTSQLPATAGDVPQSEMDQFNQDPQAHIQEKAGMLNGLAPSDWAPDLAQLDALVGSLQIAGMPSSGIQGTVWQLVARSVEGREEPLGNTENYWVVFRADGTLQFQADCNSGNGTYDVTGGMVGGLAVGLGATTLAECGPDSYADEMVNTLMAAQDYKIRPTGDILELIKPAGGGSLLFMNSGPADAAPPDTSQPPVVVPTPAPQQPMGRVTAESGVNIRTGPGTNYSVVGFAALGEEGEIIGISADGQWWVAAVPEAPNGQGWVSAAHVEVTNADRVPIIPAPPPPPPPPTPTPTATPLPAATPAPEIGLWADRTVINQGECATLSWRVENVQAVWLYQQGQPYDQFPVTGEGSQQVCPSVTTVYELRVQKRDGAVELRQIVIQVVVQNPLPNTSWALASMYVNQVPLPDKTLTLAFGADGSLSGNGGCNTFNGPYSVSGNVLAIGPLATTLMSCGDDVDQQEQTYLAALQSAATFELSGGQLVIRDAAGQEVLRFNRTG
jgi:heat shock protein HslJ